MFLSGCRTNRRRDDKARACMLQIMLLVFLLLPILAALPVWPYSSDWGYGPSGGLAFGLLLLCVLAWI